MVPVDKTELKTWKWAVTNKGWINRVVTLEWLEEVFIPRTKLQDYS
jgi:hypothetical protein